jgi:hypothetical protein
MGIVADIPQTRAHEAEGFVPGPFLYLEDLLDRFLVEKVAANPVHCVRRIADDATVAEFVSNLSNAPGLRIVRVDWDKHSFSVFEIFCLSGGRPAAAAGFRRSSLHPGAPSHRRHNTWPHRDLRNADKLKPFRVAKQ